MRNKLLALSALLVVTGIIVSLPNNKATPVIIKSIKSTPVKAQSAAPVETQPQTPVSVASTTNFTPTPAVKPVEAPAPQWGEDPTNPGVFVVFDKVGAMTAAGIPSDQQAAADSAISQVMNWRYSVAAYPGSNLCYAAPIEKMASAGADYATNPVTQLKWCTSYVNSRYGSWSAALDHVNQYHSLMV